MKKLQQVGLILSVLFMLSCDVHDNDNEENKTLSYRMDDVTRVHILTFLSEHETPTFLDLVMTGHIDGRGLVRIESLNRVDTVTGDVNLEIHRDYDLDSLIIRYEPIQTSSGYLDFEYSF